MLTSKILKRRQVVPRAITKSNTSVRIKELARPKKRYVLLTLNEKASILSPAFVDNLIRIVEIESCLSPEEAAQAAHRWRNQRRTRKTSRLPAIVKKCVSQITKDIAHTSWQRDTTMCQYLIAKRFIKSILRYRCEMQNDKYGREIVDIILKRLMLFDEFAYIPNGDQVMQQLQFLANLVASWITDILVQVSQTHKETLEEYCKKRRMRMMEVKDDEEEDD